MKKILHSENEIFPYVEYSPDEIKEGLPIIFQLHGAGERGNDLSLMSVHGFAKYFEEAQPECILILPQCEENDFWCARIESIIEFIEEKIEFYKADKKRVYLTGISMGGYGTWYTAQTRPELFAAIAPVCGGGMPWNAGVLTMPVWAFHGQEDDVVNPLCTEQMIERLVTFNKDVKYTSLAGVGHNAWDYTYDRELYEWLLSK